MLHVLPRLPCLEGDEKAAELDEEITDLDLLLRKERERERKRKEEEPLAAGAEVGGA